MKNQKVDYNSLIMLPFPYEYLPKAQKPEEIVDDNKDGY